MYYRGGNPGKYMEKLKSVDIKVIPVVASVALGRRLVRLGADALIAEGMESGGHVGEMTTISLVPMMVDAVEVPVIAAGGIADGRGFIAALALGAQGVQVGTRFICCFRNASATGLQQEVIKGKDRYRGIGVTTGTGRALHNQFTRYYLQCERQGMSKEDLEELGRGRYKAAALQGDIQQGTILCGQICGLVKQVQPAAQIVNDIIQDAIRIKKKVGGILCD